jgi:hypothetical protein
VAFQKAGYQAVAIKLFSPIAASYHGFRRFLESTRESTRELSSKHDVCSPT